jgi:hypothetical protein
VGPSGPPTDGSPYGPAFTRPQGLRRNPPPRHETRALAYPVGSRPPLQDSRPGPSTDSVCPGSDHGAYDRHASPPVTRGPPTSDSVNTHAPGLAPTRSARALITAHTTMSRPYQSRVVRPLLTRLARTRHWSAYITSPPLWPALTPRPDPDGPTFQAHAGRTKRPSARAPTAGLCSPTVPGPSSCR